MHISGYMFPIEQKTELPETFFLMGIWHGLELNFLIYGLFQGFGLFVVMFFDFALKSKKIYL